MRVRQPAAICVCKLLIVGILTMPVLSNSQAKAERHESGEVSSSILTNTFFTGGGTGDFIQDRMWLVLLLLQADTAGSIHSTRYCSNTLVFVFLNFIKCKSVLCVLILNYQSAFSVFYRTLCLNTLAA